MEYEKDNTEVEMKGNKESIFSYSRYTIERVSKKIQFNQTM